MVDRHGYHSPGSILARNLQQVERSQDAVKALGGSALDRFNAAIAELEQIVKDLRQDPTPAKDNT